MEVSSLSIAGVTTATLIAISSLSLFRIACSFIIIPFAPKNMMPFTAAETAFDRKFNS
jgi:hypothetical protein